jgi:hypothetical protein
MFKRIFGVILIGICAVCAYVGYNQYMDKTKGARAVDDFAQSTGIAKVLPEDATKPKMPNEAKYAFIAAGVTGVAGLILVIR